MKRTALVLTLLLTACATGGPRPDASPFTGQKYEQVKAALPSLAPDAGRLVFYRTRIFFGDGRSPDVLLNGEKIGDIVAGKFFVLDRPAGSFKVSSQSDQEGLSFPLAPGEVKYVRAFMTPGAFVGKMNFVLTNAAEAEPDLAKMTFVQYN